MLKYLSFPKLALKSLLGLKILTFCSDLLKKIRHRSLFFGIIWFVTQVMTDYYLSSWTLPDRQVIRVKRPPSWTNSLSPPVMRIEKFPLGMLIISLLVTEITQKVSFQGDQNTPVLDSPIGIYRIWLGPKLVLLIFLNLPRDTKRFCGNFPCLVSNNWFLQWVSTCAEHRFYHLSDVRRFIIQNQSLHFKQKLYNALTSYAKWKQKERFFLMLKI